MAKHPALRVAGKGNSRSVTDDWFEFLEALIDARVRFLVVGAHALAAHGVARATQDLDVWVEPTAGNARLVWEALEQFGAPAETLGISMDDFLRPDTVVQFGVAPNRIDILTGISGVPDFASAWGDRLQQELRGRTVPFLGRAAFLANKRASGRHKDLGDVESLGERS